MKEKEQNGKSILALVGGRLIDGTGEEPQGESTILIDGSIIESVGPKDDVKIPEGSEIIDIAGKTVMPGMMDLHVHLCLGDDDISIPGGGLFPTTVTLPAQTGIMAFARARKTLKMGFTTIRCVGEAGYVDIALRNTINAGLIEGPRIVASGTLLTTTGGHGDGLPLWLNNSAIDVTFVVDGVDGVLKAVRQQVKMKTDWVKIFATGGLMDPEDKQEFNDDELKTIIGEAHDKEKFVCAHAMHYRGTLAAVKAGVDSIEHGFRMLDETIDLMVQKGTYLVPTLYAPVAVVGKGEEYGLPKDYYERMKPFLEDCRENFPKVLAAGVKIALGTDCGYNMVYHGTNAYELELMVEFGMTPMQAIMAATKNAASCLRMEDRIGTIENGKLADIVVVEGDPLADIKVLQKEDNISLVLKNGDICANRL